VQHLDGEALLVPVRGGVDGGHAPDADHPVEPILAPEHTTEPFLRELLQLGIVHQTSGKSTRPWGRGVDPR
jgi:hypothetical protein